MTKTITRTHYSAERKAQIVLELLREERTFAQIAAEYGMHVNMLRKWKAQAVERLPSVFGNENRARARPRGGTRERTRSAVCADWPANDTVSLAPKISGLNVIEK